MNDFDELNEEDFLKLLESPREIILPNPILKTENVTSNIPVSKIEESVKQEDEMINKNNQLSIQSVTCGICTNIKFDLLKLRLHMRNSIYNFTRKSLHLSLRNPKCGIAIFETKGMIVSLGNKTFEYYYFLFKNNL